MVYKNCTSEKFLFPDLSHFGSSSIKPSAPDSVNPSINAASTFCFASVDLLFVFVL